MSYIKAPLADITNTAQIESSLEIGNELLEKISKVKEQLLKDGFNKEIQAELDKIDFDQAIIFYNPQKFLDILKKVEIIQKHSLRADNTKPAEKLQYDLYQPFLLNCLSYFNNYLSNQTELNNATGIALRNYNLLAELIKKEFKNNIDAGLIEIHDFNNKNWNIVIPNIENPKFTPEEWKLLILQNNIINNIPLTSQDKEAYFNQLLQKIQDKSFNKKLGDLLHNIDKYPELKIFKNTIKELRSFSYKCPKIEKLQLIAKKIANQQLPLTLNEFNQLNNFLSNNLIKGALKLDLNTPEFKALEQLHTELEQFYKKVIELKTNSKAFSSGNIILNSFEKKQKLEGKGTSLLNASSFEDFLERYESRLTKKYISKYSHAAATVKNDNQIFVSEIYDQYRKESLYTKTILYSDNFSLKAHRLLDHKMAKRCQKKYGTNWQQEIQEKFERITQEIHNNVENANQFNPIENSYQARFMAGLADFGIFSSHKYWFRKRDDNALYRQYCVEKDFKTKDAKICSQFVAETLAAALIQLNRELAAELEIPGKKVINLPFDDYENLSRVHPERLYRLLDQAKCIHKIGLPKELRQLVEVEAPIEFNKLSASKANQLFIQALRQNDEHIIEAIIEQNPKISQKAIEQGLYYAVLDNNTQLLQNLINKGYAPSPEFTAQALIISTEQGLEVKNILSNYAATQIQKNEIFAEKLVKCLAEIPAPQNIISKALGSIIEALVKIGIVKENPLKPPMLKIENEEHKNDIIKQLEEKALPDSIARLINEGKLTEAQQICDKLLTPENNPKVIEKVKSQIEQKIDNNYIKQHKSEIAKLCKNNTKEPRLPSIVKVLSEINQEVASEIGKIALQNKPKKEANQPRIGIMEL